MSEVTEITAKNKEFTGLVESLGSNGEGIVHMGETVFFAPFTVVGEKVKFRALKVKNRIGYAKALEILTPADERVRARCPLFTKCGGCQLQHLRYGAQLKMKSKTVSDALRKIAGIRAEVPLTVKSDFQYEYRNKLADPRRRRQKRQQRDRVLRGKKSPHRARGALSHPSRLGERYHRDLSHLHEAVPRPRV